MYNKFVDSATDYQMWLWVEELKKLFFNHGRSHFWSEAFPHIREAVTKDYTAEGLVEGSLNDLKELFLHGDIADDAEFLTEFKRIYEEMINVRIVHANNLWRKVDRDS